MGYRSEWCLAVAGSAAKVAAFKLELESEVNSLFAGPHEEILKCILDSQQPKRTRANGETLLYFHADYTKCYDPWDSVISKTIELARDKYSLKVAYSRLGEDLTDSEFSEDDDLYIPYIRQLDIKAIE